MKEGDGEIQVTTEAGVAQEAGDQEVETWAIPACVWLKIASTAPGSRSIYQYISRLSRRPPRLVSACGADDQ